MLLDYRTQDKWGCCDLFCVVYVLCRKCCSYEWMIKVLRVGNQGNTENKRVRHVTSLLNFKVLNFWKFSSYCSLKPLRSGMGEVVPARTSPTLHPPSPPTVHQFSWLALWELIAVMDIWWKKIAGNAMNFTSRRWMFSSERSDIREIVDIFREWVL